MNNWWVPTNNILSVFFSRFYSIERFDLDRSIDEVRVTYLFKWADLSNIMHIFYLLRLSRHRQSGSSVFYWAVWPITDTAKQSLCLFLSESFVWLEVDELPSTNNSDQILNNSIKGNNPIYDLIVILLILSNLKN